MTGFIKFRDKIRQLVAGHEQLLARIWHFAIALVGLLIINQQFGYMRTLNQWWIAVVIAVICAFLPIKGLTTVVMMYGLIHLASLSTDVAVTTLVLALIMLAVCGYFRAKDTYNLLTVPICYQIHLPFAISLGAGFLRSFNEIATVICGGVLSYYLKVLGDNAALFLDSSVEMTALDLIQNYVLTDQMFYFYMAAMIVMFLVVYFLRNRDMNYAWLIATASGILAEFIIMMTGYLFTGNEEEITMLVIGNVVLVGVGLVFTFFILDLDYSRVERVQFEDDEYYYYVTAVPKIKVAQEDKEVKKITEETHNRSNIRHSFARRGRAEETERTSPEHKDDETMS